MGEVIEVQFTPEEQDLVGTLDELMESSARRDIVSIAYVVQAEDGSYEMSWAGDVEFPSSIEALKVLIRNLRKQAALQAKQAAAGK